MFRNEYLRGGGDPLLDPIHRPWIWPKTGNYTRDLAYSGAKLIHISLIRLSYFLRQFAPSSFPPLTWATLERQWLPPPPSFTLYLYRSTGKLPFSIHVGQTWGPIGPWLARKRIAEGKAGLCQTGGETRLGEYFAFGTRRKIYISGHFWRGIISFFARRQSTRQDAAISLLFVTRMYRCACNDYR